MKNTNNSEVEKFIEVKNDLENFKKSYNEFVSKLELYNFKNNIKK